MWVKQIEIDGYGIFSEFSLADLSPGLNIICGPNEAGKTTLRDFITCILFGFDSRTSARDFHRPLRGGEHGGRLLVTTDDGREYLVNRHTTKKNSAPAVVLTGDGRNADEKILATLSRRLSKESYTNYFSFGLDELQAFGSLHGTELEAWLYKAGFSGRGRSLVRILKEAESSRETLWKARGKSKMSSLQTELDGLHQAISQLEEQPRQYYELLARQIQLGREITEKEDGLREVLAKAARYAKLLELWPNRQKLQQLEAQLARTQDKQSLTALVEAGDQIEGLDRSLTLYLQTTELVDQIGLKLTALEQRVKTAAADFGHGQQLTVLVGAETGRLLESEAASLAKQIQEAATVMTAIENTVAQLAEVVRERNSQFTRLSEELQRIPEDSAVKAAGKLAEHSPWPVVFWALLLVSGAGLGFLGSPAGVLLVVAAVAGLVYTLGRRYNRQRQLQAATVREQAETSARLAANHKLQQELAWAKDRLTDGQDQLSQAKIAAENARTQVSAARSTWQSFLVRHSFPESLTPDTFSSYLAALRHLQDLAQQCGETEERLNQAKKRRSDFLAVLNQLHGCLGLPLVQEYAEVAPAVVALVRRLGQARQYLANQAERTQLAERIQIALGAPCGETLWSELAGYDESTLQYDLDQLNRVIAEQRTQLDQLQSERGSVGQQIRQLEAAGELAILRTEQACRQEELARTAKEWLEWTVVQYALGKAKERYEEEQQPEVLRLASQHFCAVTQGRYQKVLSPVGVPEGIFVQAADLQRFDAAGCLSRGTAEQLYLCLRLALAEKVMQDGESLPLIIDDVLVNYDSDRFGQAVTLINHASGNHQVFFFTCHPQVAVDLAAMAARSQIWWLVDGRLADRWEPSFEGTAGAGFAG